MSQSTQRASDLWTSHLVRVCRAEGESRHNISVTMKQYRAAAWVGEHAMNNVFGQEALIRGTLTFLQYSIFKRADKIWLKLTSRTWIRNFQENERGLLD